MAEDVVGEGKRGDSPAAGATADASNPLHGHIRSCAVRDAEDDDCDSIAAIYNQAIASGRATMDTEPQDGSRYREMLSRMHERESLLVGSDPSGVVGWAIVKRYSDRPGYAITCETSVYVDERARGRGIGNSLQKAAMARARALGYRHLVAKIFAINESSVRFHEQHGYEWVGRQRNVGLVAGVLHDIVIMQRVFDETP